MGECGVKATHFPTNGGPLELGGRSVMVSSIANFSPLNTHDSTFFPLGAAGRDIFLASWTDKLVTPSWHYGTPTAVTTYTAAKERGTLNTESGDARADATSPTARRVVAGKRGTISACLRKCLFAV